MRRMTDQAMQHALCLVRPLSFVNCKKERQRDERARRKNAQERTHDATLRTLAPENLREAVQVFKDDYHKISTGSDTEAHLVALTA